MDVYVNIKGKQWAKSQTEENQAQAVLWGKAEHSLPRKEQQTREESGRQHWAARTDGTGAGSLITVWIWEALHLRLS